MRPLLLISIALFLAGCMSTKTMDEEVEEMRRKALSDLDVYECIMQGKAVAAVGMFGTPSCIEIYSDGGKTCTESSECQGECTSRDVLDEGTKTSGTCQGSGVDGFGCYNIIKNGVAGPAICYD